MNKRQGFRVHVRKPIEFLTALLEHIQEDALMSMEGDLSRCSFEEFEGIRAEPIGQRKKYPTLDDSERSNYIVFSLSEANRSRLVHDVLHRTGLKKRI